MSAFPVSPPWRFIITKRTQVTLDNFGGFGTVVAAINAVTVTSTLTFLDRLAMSRQLVYRLNTPASVTLRVPSESPEVNILTGGRPFVTNNDRFLVGFRRDFANGVDPWTVRFAGPILQVQDVGDTERALTDITAFDPWQLLYNRPVVVNAAGDLPPAGGYNPTPITGNLMAGALLADSIAAHGSVYIDPGPAFGGTANWTGVNQTTDAQTFNFQRGSTLGEAWSQIVGTGSIDIVLTPVWDPIARPGILADVSFYTAAGTTRNNAVFAWDRPSKSLIGIDRLTDGGPMANRVLYFNGSGGSAVFDAGDNVVTDVDSVDSYGQMWTTQAFPRQINKSAVLAFELRQLALRKQARKTVNFTPTPERSPDPFNEFGLGDLVPVYASAKLRQPLPAASSIQYQRVYGFTVNVSDDGLESLDMVTSDEGFQPPPTPGQSTITTSLAAISSRAQTKTTSTRSKLGKP